MDNVLMMIVGVLALVGIGMLVAILSIIRRPPAVDLDRSLRDEMRQARDENAMAARALREEVTAMQADSSRDLVNALDNNAERQRRVLDDLRRQAEESQDRMRLLLEGRLDALQRANEVKLDEMRKTVDEKLQTTLEKRLGESFKQVSDQLAQVQHGLGEMRNLASDVGGLKRVLTNVKDRGTWGEYQLHAILSEILTPDQYAPNVSPARNADRVEFAVKLPGKTGDGGDPVWLPIDAKFPKEDYERLLDASQAADMEGVKRCSESLARTVRAAARSIQEKYIRPPATTDFGIMFLPSEGLYSEVLRQPGLVADIQNNHRVIVAGPTSLSSILSSLRVGFQTLAIEQRSHEVWTVLGAVKTEFDRFGQYLDKVQRQINTASKTLEESVTRTRQMRRKLASVEALPSDQAALLLGTDTGADLSADEPESVDDE